MNTDLPEIALRGKRFAITRQSHVVASPGLPIRDIVGSGRFELREHAEKAAAAIDWRLNATVILVDKEQP